MNRKTDDRGDKVEEFRSPGGPHNVRGGSSFERPPGNGQARQKLPPEVHSFLGYRLRAAYSDLVNEPVPDALLDLLDRLKTQEREARTNDGAVQDTNEAKEKA